MPVRTSLYVLRNLDQDLMRVGKAKDPQRSLKSAQDQTEDRLELAAVVEDTQPQVEEALALFRRLLKKTSESAGGGWYRTNEHVMALLKPPAPAPAPDDPPGGDGKPSGETTVIFNVRGEDGLQALDLGRLAEIVARKVGEHARRDLLLVLSLAAAGGVVFLFLLALLYEVFG